MAVETGTFQVVMPAMGDSVVEGTILEWHKQEGDSIELDETLVEISTDKVDAEMPSPASGTVVKLYVAEGETVTVGQPLAEISVSRRTAGTAGERLDAPRRRRWRPSTGEAASGRRHRHPDRRRERHRGHDPRVVGEGR